MPECVTVCQLRRELSGKLAGSGIEAPANEAMQIISAGLDQSLAFLYARPDHRVEPDQARLLRQLADRRACRVPLAYLLGQVSFAGLVFSVGPGALVPRPDSEVLVETARRIVLERILPEQNRCHIGMSILDTCTGTGCVGISLAHQLEQTGCRVRLSLADSDDAALRWARSNLDRHGLTDRTVISKADLFSADDPGPFAVIVANPPYIETEQIEHLMPEISRYEPVVALDGGPDGLSFYRRLADEACSHLSETGWLVVEHGYNQAEGVSAILKEKGYTVLPPQLDFAGHPRVCAGRRPSS